jgi:hypothetical protein
VIRTAETEPFARTAVNVAMSPVGDGLAEIEIFVIPEPDALIVTRPTISPASDGN